jgi:hypothetical protein
MLVLIEGCDDLDFLNYKTKLTVLIKYQNTSVRDKY